jgi:hypothetical protein
LNSLCLPFIYRDLDLLKITDLRLDEFFEGVVKPYAVHAKTVRLLFLGNALSDEQIAKILFLATNVTELLLYYGSSVSIPRPSDFQMGVMPETSSAIIQLLEQGSLKSLGIYDEGIILGSWWFRTKTYYKTDSLLSQIVTSSTAKSLQCLDIALYSIPAEFYDYIRRDLPSLESLTIFHALRPNLGSIWSPDQCQNWTSNPNLTHLRLKKCSGAYAPHIPHLVRHFASLKYLLISVCGDHSDVVIGAPPTGWYTDPNALWKVRKPLDVFHLEHMVDWEIGAMGEIPVKVLVVANLRGISLTAALTQDTQYFPLLEAIRLEPQMPNRRGVCQFSQKGYEYMEEYCQKRGVALLLDAKPTSHSPGHF